jgi:hypothetical protein
MWQINHMLHIKTDMHMSPKFLIVSQPWLVRMPLWPSPNSEVQGCMASASGQLGSNKPLCAASDDLCVADAAVLGMQTRSFPHTMEMWEQLPGER